MKKLISILVVMIFATAMAVMATAQTSTNSKGTSNSVTQSSSYPGANYHSPVANGTKGQAANTGSAMGTGNAGGHAAAGTSNGARVGAGATTGNTTGTAATGTAGANAAGQSRRLPKTASPLPDLGAFGLLLLGAGVVLTRKRWGYNSN